MSGEHKIDQLFKNSIGNYRMVPTDNAWKQVESGFFGSKKLFYRRLLFAAAIILLIASVGLWYYLSGPSGHDINNQVLTDSENIDLTTNSKIPLESEKENDQIATDLPSHTVLEVIAPTTNKETIAKSGHEEETSSLTENQSSTAVDEPTSNDLQNSVLNEKHKIAIEEEKKTLSISEKSSFYVNQLVAINLGMIVNPGMIDPRQVNGMEEYLEKQHKSHFYTGLNGSVGMMYYPATKDQITWSAGLSFGLTSGKFYLESGLYYNHEQERGVYAIDLKGYDSVGYYNEVESFEINPDNPNEIIYNTKEVIVFDSIEHFTNVAPLFKYKYILIPLQVGYRFYQKDRFSASFETGLRLSLMTNKEIPDAEYTDPEFTVIRTRNLTPERVNWNLIWNAGVRFNYKLHRSLSITATPVFTKYLNSVYNTDMGYTNTKPYSMSLQIGLYYGF